MDQTCHLLGLLSVQFLREPLDEALKVVDPSFLVILVKHQPVRQFTGRANGSINPLIVHIELDLWEHQRNNRLHRSCILFGEVVVGKHLFVDFHSLAQL